MGKFKTQQEAEAAGVYISKVKSFVKREGRLTNAQARAIETHWPTMGIDYQDAQLDIAAQFDSHAPIVLEIGFGMGTSLVEMAKQNPQYNYLGIEVHRPGVGACLSSAETHNVKNLRVMEHDAVEVLKHMLPDGSLTRVQLFFPDPWHKKRHHKRRIVQPDFVALIAQKLTHEGIFHMATDWEPYAEYMLEVMRSSDQYENTSAQGDYVPRPDYRPITKFETRGTKLGHGVWDLVFKRSA